MAALGLWRHCRCRRILGAVKTFLSALASGTAFGFGKFALRQYRAHRSLGFRRQDSRQSRDLLLFLLCFNLSTKLDLIYEILIQPLLVLLLRVSLNLPLIFVPPTKSMLRIEHSGVGHVERALRAPPIQYTEKVYG